MEEKTSEARDSRFELMRIIAMIMIVAFHLLPTIRATASNCTKTDDLFFNCFGCWGILGVYLFVLISCYFSFHHNTSCDQNIKTNCLKSIWNKKVCGIVIMTAFYIFVNIILIPSYSTVSHALRVFTEGLICDPIFLRRYWFVIAYIFLQFSLPLLNRLPVTKKLFVFCNILLIISSVSSGGGILNDAMQFILVAIFFKHVVKLQNVKEFFRRYAVPGFLLVTTLLLVASFTCQYLQEEIITKNASNASIAEVAHTIIFTVFNFGRFSYFLVIDAAFIFFVFLKIRPLSSRCINYVASLMFGIYLFHEFPGCPVKITAVRMARTISSNNIIVYLTAVLIIFLSGMIVEVIRKYIFIYIRSLLFKNDYVNHHQIS